MWMIVADFNLRGNVANNAQCPFCGWTDASHDEVPDGAVAIYGDPREVMPGYSISLYECCNLDPNPKKNEGPQTKPPDV